MPAISLGIFVYHKGGLLRRPLQHAAGCCDDLVVVDDRPDTTQGHPVVKAAGGAGFLKGRAPFTRSHIGRLTGFWLNSGIS